MGIPDNVVTPYDMLMSSFILQHETATRMGHNQLSHPATTVGKLYMWSWLSEIRATAVVLRLEIDLTPSCCG